MLEIRDLKVSYGPIDAIRGVSLTCKPGHITALIGANGAGKSSLMKAISGIVSAKSGEILMDGVDIGKMPAHERAQIGLAHALEGRRIFHQHSVIDNLKTAWLFRKPSGNYSEAVENVFENFPILREKRDLKAGTLSGGQQQMLIISMATLHKPRFLLLDEPSLGLAPIIVSQIFEYIRDYCASTNNVVLLSEQMATLALKVADFGYALKQGQVVFQGTRDELLSAGSDELASAYLG